MTTITSEHLRKRADSEARAADACIDAFWSGHFHGRAEALRQVADLLPQKEPEDSQ